MAARDAASAAKNAIPQPTRYAVTPDGMRVPVSQGAVSELDRSLTTNPYKKAMVNTQKVVNGEKPATVIRPKGADYEIRFTKELHDYIVAHHPEQPTQNFNSLLGYVKTLNIPDNVLRSKNRVNYIRQLGNDYGNKINVAGTKLDPTKKTTYLNTSFLQGGTNRNARPLDGPAKPSSPVGGRAVISALKSNDIVPKTEAKVNPTVQSTRSKSKVQDGFTLPETVRPEAGAAPSIVQPLGGREKAPYYDKVWLRTTFLQRRTKLAISRQN